MTAASYQRNFERRTILSLDSSTNSSALGSHPSGLIKKFLIAELHALTLLVILQIPSNQKTITGIK